ncbi:PLD nuclease N-terminal domain-containing protein [Pseudomonas baetica]|uniref:PLD nuclease N-terminal domain-containing protein n=1 Tax=Pseudomonas baetica TaxID=674054 RepID=UPI002961B251|nr:PLDc_N domain-containing protein [Pseudomonas putida]
MGSFLYNFIAFVIFVLDIWAIINVVRSNAETLKKVLWVALVAFLPVLGLIIWALAGPRGNVRLGSSH